MNVPIIDPDAKEDRKKILVDYFSTNRHNHEFYAFRKDQLSSVCKGYMNFGIYILKIVPNDLNNACNIIM